MKVLYSKFGYKLILISTIILFFILQFKYDLWNIAKLYVYFDRSSGFGDLNLLLKGIDYYRMGKDPLRLSYSPPYNYPSFWKYFANIPLFTIANTSTLGYILQLGNLLLFTILLGKIGGFKHFIYVILVLISPVSILIFERGNSDLIILLLLQIFLVSSWKNPIVLAVLIITCTFLKIYPACWLAVLIFDLKKQYIYLYLATAIIIAGYFLISIDEFALIKLRTPYDISRLTYGFFKPLYILSLDKNTYIKFIYTILIFGGSSALILFKNSTKAIEIDMFWNREKMMFVFGTITVSFTSLIAINWEYRLFFLILCIPLLFKSFNYYSKFLLIIILYIFWTQTLHRFIIQDYKIYLNLLNQLIIIFLNINLLYITIHFLVEKKSYFNDINRYRIF